MAVDVAVAPVKKQRATRGPGKAKKGAPVTPPKSEAEEDGGSWDGARWTTGAGMNGLSTRPHRPCRPAQRVQRGVWSAVRWVWRYALASCKQVFEAAPAGPLSVVDQPAKAVRC